MVSGIRSGYFSKIAHSNQIRELGASSRFVLVATPYPPHLDLDGLSLSFAVRSARHSEIPNFGLYMTSHAGN